MPFQFAEIEKNDLEIESNFIVEDSQSNKVLITLFLLSSIGCTLIASLALLRWFNKKNTNKTIQLFANSESQPKSVLQMILHTNNKQQKSKVFIKN